jgi:hypothetical protein
MQVLAGFGFGIISFHTYLTCKYAVYPERTGTDLVETVEIPREVGEIDVRFDDVG